MKICAYSECGITLHRKQRKYCCYEHSRLARIRPLEERFWEKVNITNDENECWEWQGSTDINGYGKFGLNQDQSGKLNSQTKAHRIAWILTFGEIPDDIFVLHMCDNPPCCNPFHLFEGTQINNMQDCKIKGRTRKKRSLVHGTSHGYRMYKCRCSKCVKVHRRNQRMYFKKYRAKQSLKNG